MHKIKIKKNIKSNTKPYFTGVIFFAIFISGFFVSYQSASADTHTAATCSLINVSAAIAAASSGDTVSVPAGNCTWNNGLDITKGIILTGAGIVNTVITSNLGGSYGSNVLINYEPTTDQPFEISGFTLIDSPGEIQTALRLSGSNSILTQIKIHNNRFQHFYHGVNPMGKEAGVFYTNDFQLNRIDIFCGFMGLAGWAWPHSLGSANNIYFEDNTFSNPPADAQMISECGQGGRIVFRHNTITGWGATADTSVMHDFHGDQGDSATVIAEVYHNTYSVQSGAINRIQSFIFQRNGTALVANNAITGATGGGLELTEYHAWSASVGCSPYPYTSGGYMQGLTNSFYWNNVRSGTLLHPYNYCGVGCDVATCGTSPWDDTFIQLNRDYFEPTAGLESSLPATCTTNTYYGTTDTDKIYKCTSVNNWTIYYTPYTYPHPLRNEGSGDTTPPSAPQGLSVT